MPGAWRRAHGRLGRGKPPATAESSGVADPPDMLTLRRHRDLVGRERRPVFRWVILSVLGLFLLLGLLNLFGQRPATDAGSSGAASLEVYSPDRVRGGLVFESRFTIRAQRDIAKANLVLEPGWLEGMTLNTVEPSPVGEASRDGRISFDLGHIPAGAKHVLFLHFSVNPTNVGRRSTDVDLLDGETPIAHVDRSVTVYP